MFKDSSKKILLFMIVIISSFNSITMESGQIHYPVVKEENDDSLEYSLETVGWNEDYIIVCTLHKTGYFAGKKSCYRVDKKSGGKIEDIRWFDILQYMYTIRKSK